MNRDRIVTLAIIVATAIITGTAVFVFMQAPPNTIYPTTTFENMTLYSLPIQTDDPQLQNIILVYSPYNSMFRVYLNLTDAKDDLIHQENEWSIRFTATQAWSNYP